MVVAYISRAKVALISFVGDTYISRAKVVFISPRKRAKRAKGTLYFWGRCKWLLWWVSEWLLWWMSEGLLWWVSEGLL